MEWYWWIIIVVAVLAVVATLSLFIGSGPEDLETEEKAEEKQKLVLLSLSNDGTVKQLRKDGLTLDANGGEEYFEVEENLSTGYQWILKTDDCDIEVVKIVDGYEPPVSEEEYDIVGAPGTRYFTFTGVGEG